MPNWIFIGNFHSRHFCFAIQKCRYFSQKKYRVNQIKKYRSIAIKVQTHQPFNFYKLLQYQYIRNATLMKINNQRSEKKQKSTEILEIKVLDPRLWKYCEPLENTEYPPVVISVILFSYCNTGSYKRIKIYIFTILI